MFRFHYAKGAQIGLLTMAARCVPAALLLLPLMVSTASAAPATGPYVRIEQDWELVIATPDPTGSLPQVVLQMAPSPTLPVTCVLLLNYNDTPSFSAGGVSLHFWNVGCTSGVVADPTTSTDSTTSVAAVSPDSTTSAGAVSPDSTTSRGAVLFRLKKQNTLLANQAFGNGATLNTVGEKITWTQYMELSNGSLKFGISRGSLPTWGPVPTAGWVVSTPYTTLTTFTNYYQTSGTMAKSGILAGASSVQSLKLIAVRKYDAKGWYDSEAGQTLY